MVFIARHILTYHTGIRRKFGC